MLRSRVLSSIDTARLSQAVARPGIDPRIWVSYAVLIEEPEVVTDAGDEDIIADIMLLPSGTVETARVGAIYAGNGFGLYAPLHKDDEVVVVAPSGDPDEGLVITHRMWSPADKPPDLVKDNPEDFVLVIEKDKNLRMKMQGSGSVFLDVASGGGVTVNVAGSGDVKLNVDSGKVYLGGDAGTEPVAKGQTLKSYLDDMVLKLNTHVHNATSLGAPTTPCTTASPPTTFTGPVGITASKAEVL